MPRKKKSLPEPINPVTKTRTLTVSVEAELSEEEVREALCYWMIHKYSEEFQPEDFTFNMNVYSGDGEAEFTGVSVSKKETKQTELKPGENAAE